MMRNIPEFHWVDLGVLLVGATPVSIYNSSSADQVAYLAGHSEGVVAVVENEAFLNRFLEVRDQLPALRSIVTIVNPSELPDGVLGREALTDNEPVDLEEAVEIGSPEDLATVIYTSGTTGNPKGVMITNANVCWVMEAGLQSYGWTREDMAGMKVVSYLPMAHIAERIVSHYSLCAIPLQVTTCPDTSMLLTHLQGTHPDIVFGVPRIWEKLYGGVTAALAADPEKAEKFNEAVAAARTACAPKPSTCMNHGVMPARSRVQRTRRASAGAPEASAHTPAASSAVPKRTRIWASSTAADWKAWRLRRAMSRPRISAR